jgi:hypothetical protein
LTLFLEKNKNLYYEKNHCFITFVTTLFSCSSDDESPFKDYKGKWILTQMTGMTANSQTTGSDMEWQEFYLLNANGTFKKSRKKMDL